jgi:hypothetical protein
MRKFVVRGFCFALIGLVLLYTCNFFYVRTNGYKSLDDRWKFYLVPDNITVMNLGSSHGEYGLEYYGIPGITAFNFALPGQSFYYDLKLLEKYGAKLSPGCTVIIPVSYFSFVQARDYNNQRILYYRFFDYGSIQNHSLIEYIKFRLFPVLGAGMNAKYILHDKQGIGSCLIGGVLRTDDIEGYKQNAQLHYEYYLGVQGKGGNEGFNTENLKGILEYCREHGFKPVLITTPFTKYYNEKFSEQFFSDFYLRITLISQQYGIAYLDYSHDPRFTDHLELFIDSNHLSDSGRQAFTRILLSDLGIIPGG